MKKKIKMLKRFTYNHQAHFEATRPPKDRENKSGPIEFVFDAGKVYEVEDNNGNEDAFANTTTLTFTRDGMPFEIPFPTSAVEYVS